jgi:hypothetical protein
VPTKHGPKIQPKILTLIERRAATMPDQTPLPERIHPDRLYSIKECAYFLNLAPRTVYNGIGKHARRPFYIPVKRTGGKPQFRGKDLLEFINS